MYITNHKKGHNICLDNFCSTSALSNAYVLEHVRALCVQQHSRIIVHRPFFLSSGCTCVCSVLVGFYLCWRLLAVCGLSKTSSYVSLSLSLHCCESVDENAAGGRVVCICLSICLSMCMFPSRGCFTAFDKQKGSGGVMGREEVSR